MEPSIQRKFREAGEGGTSSIRATVLASYRASAFAAKFPSLAVFTHPVLTSPRRGVKATSCAVSAGNRQRDIATDITASVDVILSTLERPGSSDIRTRCWLGSQLDGKWLGQRSRSCLSHMICHTIRDCYKVEKYGDLDKRLHDDSLVQENNGVDCERSWTRPISSTHRGIAARSDDSI
jgi:hypothetical protein